MPLFNFFILTTRLLFELKGELMHEWFSNFCAFNESILDWCCVDFCAICSELSLTDVVVKASKSPIGKSTEWLIGRLWRGLPLTSSSHPLLETLTRIFTPLNSPGILKFRYEGCSFFQDRQKKCVFFIQEKKYKIENQVYIF